MGVFRLSPAGDSAGGMVESDMVPADAFTTADHTELIHTAHFNEQTGVSSGVWKCAPCFEKIAAYPVDEQMTVISGSVTVTPAEGPAEVFGPGDTFFIAKGTPCTWEITQTLHKYFMISE